MRELLRFLLVGLVAGWVTSILIRGRIIRLRGCFPFVLFGVAGALAGGYLFDLIGQSDVSSVIAATAGAVALLVFLQVLRNA